MAGYSVVGLHHPKNPANVGGALRAAYCYGAKSVMVSGNRKGIRHAADTTKIWRHDPVFCVDDLGSVIPFDCVPVAIDLVAGAVPLPEYRHPIRAFYVFGPEDGTLGDSVLSWCRDVVMVPTTQCMNLAATVNVVLYDRLAKQSLLARSAA